MCNYMQQVAHKIAAPLSYLINSSLEKGVLPNVFKLTKIVPIHKTGYKETIENIRPLTISLVSIKVYRPVIL